MATITKHIDVGVTARQAWDALADFGAVHERVARGFAAATRLNGGDRIVTFVSGAVARERLVSLDGDRRRLVYSIVESGLGLAHHQASVEVIDDPAGCHLVWTVDVLPVEVAPVLEGLMDEGATAIARTLAG